MSFGIQNTPHLKSNSTESPRIQNATTQNTVAFASTFQKAATDLTQYIPPSEHAHQAQSTAKKKRIEAVEEQVPVEEEDSLVKTVHIIAKKLKNLAELERKARGF
jgi:hypothetical protein